MTTVFDNPTASSAPKISIVTPSYNQGAFIEQTINSVLDQGYPNLEYIIIDGGSTDSSVNIIQKYEEHLAYWCSEPDGGHYRGVKKGFALATGEIFAWLNSDDIYMPQAFEKVSAIFQTNPKVSWLTTTRQILLNEAGKRVREIRIPGFDRKAFLDGVYLSLKGFRLGFIQQESTFWRSSLWERVGGLDPDYELAADFDLWAKFYRHTELYGVESNLGAFRKHADNRSQDIEEYLSQAARSLESLRQDLNWPGHSNYFKLLDHLCHIPKFNWFARNLRSVFGGSYQGRTFQSARNSRDGTDWVEKTKRF